MLFYVFIIPKLAKLNAYTEPLAVGTLADEGINDNVQGAVDDQAQ